jgi:flavin reductase (DIM6/NTAB) family NADH-FMN oxidoreductase RutF
METSAPLFEASLARFERRLVGMYPSGDHALMLGEMVHFDTSADSVAKELLLYYRSSFPLFQQEISPPDPPAVEALTW